MSDIQKCQYCGHVYDANEEVHPACNKPQDERIKELDNSTPKPSERDLKANAFTDLAVRINCKYSTDESKEDYAFGVLFGYKNGWDHATLSERKRCEEMLEIAEKALDEISLMNIRNIKADQKEGRFWDWKDEARKALARIKALKATQAATVEGKR